MCLKRSSRGLQRSLVIVAATAFLAGTPAIAQAGYPVDRGDPPASAVFEETFGPLCGARANAAYARAIRHGFTRYQAILLGHAAGRECAAGVGEWVRERLRAPRLELVTPEVPVRLSEGP
jgi:hypothetical protein